MPQPLSPTRPRVSPRLDRQGDAVDGVDDLVLAAEPGGAADREVDLQVAHVDDGRATGTRALGRGDGLRTDGARSAPRSAPRCPGSPASRSPTRSWCQHAARWSLRARASAGASRRRIGRRRTRSAARTRSPDGEPMRSGGWPGMLWNTPAVTRSTRGTQRSSPSVYGWRGSANSSSRGRHLDDPAAVHHRDPVADAGDDARGCG